MTLIVLKTFLAILETGSLVQAARHLNVTQSTVTARLQALEETLGQKLLTRDKAGIALTAAGAKFRRYAETITQLWQQAEQETGLPAGVDMVCNIGCSPDLWPAYGKQVLAALKQAVPSAAVSLLQGSDGELKQWLSAGLIDLAIGVGLRPQAGQVLHVIGEDRLVVVSSRKDGPVRFDPDYIYVEAGDEFARWHTRHYADAGTARVSFGSAIWALEYLFEHGGSAYLPEALAARAVAQGRLFVLEDGPVFERRVTLVGAADRVQGWDWLEG